MALAPTLFVSVAEVARRLGISPRAARIHVQAGRIPAIKLGRTYHVRADALEDLAAAQAAERREAHGGER